MFFGLSVKNMNNVQHVQKKPNCHQNCFVHGAIDSWLQHLDLWGVFCKKLEIGSLKLRHSYLKTATLRLKSTAVSIESSNAIRKGCLSQYQFRAMSIQFLYQFFLYQIRDQQQYQFTTILVFSSLNAAAFTATLDFFNITYSQTALCFIIH